MLILYLPFFCIDTNIVPKLQKKMQKNANFNMIFLSLLLLYKKNLTEGEVLCFRMADHR